MASENTLQRSHLTPHFPPSPRPQPNVFIHYLGISPSATRQIILSSQSSQAHPSPLCPPPKEEDIKIYQVQFVLPICSTSLDKIPGSSPLEKTEPSPHLSPHTRTHLLWRAILTKIFAYDSHPHLPCLSGRCPRCLVTLIWVLCVDFFNHNSMLMCFMLSNMIMRPPPNPRIRMSQ